MKNLILIFFVIISCGCKKQIEKAQTNAVIEAMTKGQWKITSFKKGSADITNDFANYMFQFKENFTVDAINKGTVEKTGSWNADVNTKTITSSFANASDPLPFINGTWLITNNSWTFVEASQTIASDLYTLRLDKQ